MKEDLLQFIWQKQLFQGELKTLKGERLSVIHPGQLNRFSGPDFSNARIKINDMLWAGNVEIHVKESDWYKHKHENDPAYQNIILHVVSEVGIKRSETGHPTLNLFPHIDQKLIQNYEVLMGGMNRLACSGHIGTMTWEKRNLWLEAMGLERFKLKVEEYQRALHKSMFDFDRLLMELLFKAFGFSSNKFAFEQLAERVDPSYLLRLSDKVESIYILLRGLSSLELTEIEKREFNVLKGRFKLQAIEHGSWKTGAVRPANKPELRLAQLAELLSRFEDLRKALNSMLNPKELMGSLFEIRKLGIRPVGQSSQENILINAFAPYVFILGDYKDDQQLKDYAISMLDQIGAEENRFTRIFASEGLEADSALDSQAMIHLFRNYCRPKKCLNCAIGNDLMLNHDRKN